MKHLLCAILLANCPIAAACLTTERWQNVPSSDTVEHVDAVFLATLEKLEPSGTDEILAYFGDIEALKGQPIRVLRTEKVVALHKYADHFDELHSSDDFWNGELANTVLMGDCSFAPREFVMNGRYLILAYKGQLTTAVSFELISDVQNDEWLQMVRRQLNESATNEP